ncbi:hypothetical protein FIBSPDRAFT_870703 [Athelia psychrophila]|uniref:Uncharacterized protein n=1 Tax=Athelia psychrophila TaxID=1759441 RepID=A0A166ATR2_9AGAM|nr:hypothetical protein FIBSPDRAFT_870703 [Fibularhizoctonia sp. CBS 109695]
MHDTLSPSKLADLHNTLPTRDGTHFTSIAPAPAPHQRPAPLGYGHHLEFFHTHNPEAAPDICVRYWALFCH